MDKPEALEIRLNSLLAWVLTPVLAMTAFGVLPTWLLDGWRGVAAEVVAVAVVLLVMIGSGSMTVWAARMGSSSAATVFLGCSLIRLVLCPVLVGAAWWITGLPFKPMGVWMVIAYLTCLAMESTWLVRALRSQKREVRSQKTE